MRYALDVVGLCYVSIEPAFLGSGNAMLISDAAELLQESLWLVLVLAGPPVAAAAIVGLVIAFFQATTQLQEFSLQYAAKFFAVILTLFFMATIAGGALLEFSDRIFSDFPVMVGA